MGERSVERCSGARAQAELHRCEEELERLERANLLEETRVAELERERLKTGLRLCVCIQLGRAAEQTAGPMNLPPRSVATARCRLRKKLGPNEHIGSVLQ